MIKDTTPSACSKAVDDNCLTDSSCLERDFPLNKRCLLYLNTLWIFLSGTAALMSHWFLRLWHYLQRQSITRELSHMGWDITRITLIKTKVKKTVQQRRASERKEWQTSRISSWHHLTIPRERDRQSESSHGMGETPHQQHIWPL